MVRFGQHFADWCRMTCRLRWYERNRNQVEFQYGGRLGEFNSMSSQSHLPHCRCCHLANSISWTHSYVSHCRVLPPGEFTLMISEPHATLQGVRIPSAILKIDFAIFYFFFLMLSGLWREAAFVSSPIHLLSLIVIIVITYHYCKASRTRIATAIKS